MVGDRLSGYLRRQLFAVGDAPAEASEGGGHPPCVWAEQTQSCGKEEAAHEERVGEKGPAPFPLKRD
jgi:hypothetical protein